MPLHPITERDREFLDGNQRVFIRVMTGPLETAEADSPAKGTILSGSGLFAPRLVRDRISQNQKESVAYHELEYRAFMPKV